MADCPHTNSWFRRCHFEARYDATTDASPVTPQVIQALGDKLIFGDDINEAIETMVKSKVYVRDVCVRCGRAIERREPVKP